MSRARFDYYFRFYIRFHIVFKVWRQQALLDYLNHHGSSFLKSGYEEDIWAWNFLGGNSLNMCPTKHSALV